MASGSTKIEVVILLTSFCFWGATFGDAVASSAQTGTMNAVAQASTRFAASEPANPAHLLGTVVDSSGAVIVGATVQLRTSDGAFLRTTQSDRNGSFLISGLPAGDYRLVVLNPDFET